MVLSNKKQKQKLRIARAELLAASGNVHPAAQPSTESAAALKKSFSKREKRRITRPLEAPDAVNSKAAVDAEEVNFKLDEQTGLKEKVKSKKRKRAEGSENNNNPEAENNSKSNKKKKKKKKKKKSKKNTDLNQTAEAVVVVKEGDVNMMEASIEQQTEKREEIIEVSTKVYAGGIPYYSTEDDIRSFFESCGTITELDCMVFPESGKFRGIAILTFKTEAAAKRALALDGSDMGGLFLKISPFKSTNKVKKTFDSAPKAVEGYNRIYAGNLSWEITEDDLKKHFSDCNITSIRFGEDKETKEFKGYAHIDFSDSQSLSNALKLDQTLVCGRPVKISCAVPLRNPQQPNSTKTEEPLAVAKSIDNTASETYVPKNTTTEEETVVAVSGKIRRRTCYECGGKGHLSSACPNKPAVEPNSTKSEEPLPAAKSGYTTTQAKTEAYVPKTTSNTYVPRYTTDTYVPKYTTTDTYAPKYTTADTYAPKYTTTEEENVVAVSGKIRRRTCYECGGKGHLSSACPNKQAIEPNSTKTEEPLPAAKSGYNTTPTITETYVPKTTTETNVITPIETAAVSGKIRRRTCYECGEKGHLSSACPKKQGVNPIIAV
ncbi:phragmoplastin interacting protein 1 [Impatiens glandulifera]|uniref:phragmoplastin interacting protein 1 n=1 Tax=Impatiens glandulifera TaxID=253017 RepID=UPI001FB17D42|nr:phragmoplastin interacting protein 1 [Impatiens glandulifera]